MRPAPTIVTVGNFDGVHVGHGAIVARAGDLARSLNAAGGVVVLAFDPHPATTLAPERAPAQLTGFEERAGLLRRAGAGRVIRLAPTDELLGLSPEAFFEWVVATHNPRAFVEGTDFRFGRGRAGSVETLRELGRPRGIDIELVRPVAVALSDHSVVTASSSVTRWLLGHGRVRDAWSVLGRPHRLSGTVVRGDRRGRDLGFPTANLETRNMLPRDGVYAAIAQLPDGSRRGAAVSVGSKPQFGGGERTAEAYILDAPGAAGTPNLPGLAEYGWTLGLELVGWVRDQMRFDSIGRLVEQMGRDCDRVRSTIEIITGPVLHAGVTTS